MYYSGPYMYYSGPYISCDIYFDGPNISPYIT